MKIQRAGTTTAAVAGVRAGTTARRILLAEAAVVGGWFMAMLIREIPGLVREVRIWRIANLRSGASHPR